MELALQELEKTGDVVHFKGAPSKSEEPEPAPVININQARKRIRVWSTKDGGLEGISEPIEDAEAEEAEEAKV